MKKLMLMLFMLASVSTAFAAVQSREIDYLDGDVQLRGYLYWDDSISGKRPGVLVAHEWWGLNDYARRRARMLAELGYVAFAADMYGPDKITTHAEDAGGWMKQITANVEGWRNRALLGLDLLQKDANTDPARLAAIGYCFGGATVMQMVYADAPLKGVVSFHGSLPVGGNLVPGSIDTKILIQHGDQDPFVPAERITAFKEALTQAGADWEMDIYSGARHAFTNPDADSMGMDALRYNASADQRSWQRMKDFLAEIFAH